MEFVAEYKLACTIPAAQASDTGERGFFNTQVAKASDMREREFYNQPHGRINGRKVGKFSLYGEVFHTPDRDNDPVLDGDFWAMLACEVYRMTGLSEFALVSPFCFHDNKKGNQPLFASASCLSYMKR